MEKDIEIAQKAKPRLIKEIAKKAGFLPGEVELHGDYKAKIMLSAFKRLENKKDGKLILVTTTTPTPAGEGKTTVTIGLAEAFSKTGKKAFACIREPSLGPVMGQKGGAAGGGYSQVLPMDEINLHFVGDMHVITSAHNLLASMVDNHIYYGNALDIDPQRITWRRVMDMNDRALRDIQISIGSVIRQSGFDITAASEVMAIMCLSETLEGMKKNLGKIIIGYNQKGFPVIASQIKAEGAMALLMKEALRPNLVQTIEGTPAFVHGGPFANIAHGCSSIVATKIALKVADYVVTEAGFGTDLGAEKFFDIKCRVGAIKPSAVVLVASTKAMRYQGGAEKERMHEKNITALQKGLENLGKHIENIKFFNLPFVVAVNRTEGDTPEEIGMIFDYCKGEGIPVEIADVWEKGGKGGINLAKKLIQLIKKPAKHKYLYSLDDTIEQKIQKVAALMYGAEGVEYSEAAKDDIALINRIGLAKLPVCIAKTQSSLSDNPLLKGRPKGFKIKVRGLKPQAGAGFIVVYTGKIVTMPGLPQKPAAENMDINEKGKIKGLF